MNDIQCLNHTKWSCKCPADASIYFFIKKGIGFLLLNIF